MERESDGERAADEWEQRALSTAQHQHLTQSPAAVVAAGETLNTHRPLPPRLTIPR